MKTFTFELPSFIEIFNKKSTKKVYLNLNSYSNLNFRVKKKVKELLKIELEEQLESCPIFKNKVKIFFQVKKTFVNKEKSSDKSNYFSVTSKILYDFLTQEEKWIDDNDNIISEEILLETEHIKSDHASCTITFRIEEIN